MQTSGTQSEDRRAGLRGAVASANGQAVVAILRKRGWPDLCLQLVGDGLVIALAGRVDGADELARTCAVELLERDWDGDAELAATLEARLGTGPTPLLRPLAVDLDELAGVVEGDPSNGGGRIDLRTGEVWPQSAIEYAAEVGDIDEDEDDPDRWLRVLGEGSRAGYRDMEIFIADLADPTKQERLSRAIVGRGAFRRFKDQLSTWPDDLDRWHAFSEDRHRGRARAWLAAEGYTPAAAHRET